MRVFNNTIKVYKRSIDERYTIATATVMMSTLEGNVNYKKCFYIITGYSGE